MNPVVVTAVAISLVLLGTVSMASIASQQAVSNANLQKTILERDRLSEQVNAFISAVTPSGSNTVATVKNTGSSPVTIDHCLVLSPSSGNLRPTATRVPGVSSSTVNPGSIFDITIPGAVTGDNIKCVTSKGTILPVKMDAVSYDNTPDPNNYFDLYGISADVGIRTAESHSTLNMRPINMPPIPPLTIPSGTLTYYIPVESTVTVNRVVVNYKDGTNSIIIQQPTTFRPGQKITIPVTKPVDKFEIRYIDPVTSQQSSFIVRPSQASTITSTILSGPTSVGMYVYEGYTFGSMIMPDGSWVNNAKQIYAQSRYLDQLGFGGEYTGPTYCGSGRNRTYVDARPVYQGGGYGNWYNQHRVSINANCIGVPYYIYQDPISTLNIKFMAPKQSFLLKIDYLVNVWGIRYYHLDQMQDFRFKLDVNNGRHQIQFNDIYSRVDTYNYGYRTTYYWVDESGSVTLPFTNMVPGQEIIIPISVSASGSGVISLYDNRYYRGAIEIHSDNALRATISLIA